MIFSIAVKLRIRYDNRTKTFFSAVESSGTVMFLSTSIRLASIVRADPFVVICSHPRGVQCIH